MKMLVQRQCPKCLSITFKGKCPIHDKQWLNSDRPASTSLWCPTCRSRNIKTVSTLHDGLTCRNCKAIFDHEQVIIPPTK